jgi:D-3-phosphoglycerate dehydrogenase
MVKVLLTSTSFQDTPGAHQRLLYSQGFDITTMRGPLAVADLLPVIDGFDAVLCGDDSYTEQVLTKGRHGRLRYLGKYGVGLDRIDLAAAKRLGITVTNVPGVNQRAVAEHVFGLLLCFQRNIHTENKLVHEGHWTRYTGHEIQGKRIGVFGLGAVGREVAGMASLLGLSVAVCDPTLHDDPLPADVPWTTLPDIDALLSWSDFVSLHVPHTPDTHEIIRQDSLDRIRGKGLVLINTARGKLVNNADVLAALDDGTLQGYLADVVDEEPITPGHPFLGHARILLTPHIGSRTFESVERQGLATVRNLLDFLGLN